MKKVFIFIIFYSLLEIYSQENPTHTLELMLGTENSSETIQFDLTAVGPTWYYSNITNNSLLLHSIQQIYGNSDPSLLLYGWNIYWHAGNKPLYADGLYELRANTGGYIYLDYRNCTISQDISIKYNNSTKKFNYLKSPMTEYQEANNGKLIIIWDIYDQGIIPNVSCFNNYFANCLNLLNQNNHPALIWGPNPLFGATHYKIYRAESYGPSGNPESLNYSLIATVESNTFKYTDFDVLINENSFFQYYYIKGYKFKNNTYSSRTNIVNVQGSIYKKNLDYNENIKNIIYLKQNYPNPFNPLTKITYSVDNTTFVQLKIFNAIGKDISLLVNEKKNKGIYEVEFDASDLASGIYFYQLKTNNLILTKKMLVLK